MLIFGFFNLEGRFCIEGNANHSGKLHLAALTASILIFVTSSAHHYNFSSCNNT